MKFDVERWESFGEDFKALSPRHWLEVAQDKDEVKLDPDWETYRKADEIGKMIFVSAREGGELMGYCVWAISHPLHFKSTLYAQNDVIYLEPEYRGHWGLK